MKAKKFRVLMRLMWAAMRVNYAFGKPRFWTVPFPHNSPQDDREEDEAHREAQL